MNSLLNTLYVTTQGAYLKRDHENLVVLIEQKEALRIPIRQLGDLVLFGRVTVSHGIIALCNENRLAVTYMSNNGEFLGQLRGPTSGNVLLRLNQYALHNAPEQSVAVARNCVAGKINNCRNLLMRACRDTSDQDDMLALRTAANRLRQILAKLKDTDQIDTIRGYEGDAAYTYFRAFTRMIKSDREAFRFDTRNRRPPRDPINALLSFAYALLAKDCTASLDAVGLDPQIGYLHVPRPGRPSLALDLMEEFRPIVADRLILTLVNRKQITADDFECIGGTARLHDAPRKRLLVAYQERKKHEVPHTVLERNVPLGLVPHLQAKLMARVIRKELKDYPPFIHR